MTTIFDEMLDKFLEKFPDSELAKLPMNGFEYQLLRLIGTQPLNSPKDATNLIWILNNVLGSLIFAVAMGNSEAAIDILGALTENLERRFKESPKNGR